MANDTVLWEIDRRGVATVTLNRPKVNNAYNGDLIQGLHDAMDALGKGTAEFAARRMNQSVQRALSGKKIEELES